MDWNTIAVTVAAVIVAMLNAYTAWQASRTRADVVATRADVRTLEKNTNSKMDAMLELTAKSSRAQGRKEGRAAKARPKAKAKR